MTETTITQSANKQSVQRYIDAFGKTEIDSILDCLTDDVEWLIPGTVHRIGKADFEREIQPEGNVGSPAITVTRLVEHGDVVVAEGMVEQGIADGSTVHIAFCDIFEMEGGLIRRLISYVMQVPEQGTIEP